MLLRGDDSEYIDKEERGAKRERGLARCPHNAFFTPAATSTNCKPRKWKGERGHSTLAGAASAFVHALPCCNDRVTKEDTWSLRAHRKEKGASPMKVEVECCFRSLKESV